MTALIGRLAYASEQTSLPRGKSGWRLCRRQNDAEWGKQGGDAARIVMRRVWLLRTRTRPPPNYDIRVTLGTTTPRAARLAP